MIPVLKESKRQDKQKNQQALLTAYRLILQKLNEKEHQIKSKLYQMTCTKPEKISDLCLLRTINK